jgi:hypothetical protein
MKSAQEEFEQCRSYPAIYDFLKDGCRSKASDYRSARSSFESAKSYLDSALDDIDSSLRAVSASCEFSFAASGGTGSDRLCRLLQRMKGRVATDKLMEACTKAGKTLEECRACVQ